MSTGKPRVEPILKLLLAAVVVVAVTALVGLLPPLDRQVPGTGPGVILTFEAVVTALAGVVVLGLLLLAASRLEALIVDRVDGPPALVADAGAVVKYVIAFLAITAVYRPIADGVVPLFRPSATVWVFELIYVLAALAPLVAAVYLVVTNLDELTALLFGGIRSASEELGREQPGGASDDEVAEAVDDDTPVTPRSESTTEADEHVDDAHGDTSNGDVHDGDAEKEESDDGR